jgi:hypothetical protein
MAISVGLAQIGRILELHTLRSHNWHKPYQDAPYRNKSLHRRDLFISVHISSSEDAAAFSLSRSLRAK